MYAEKYLVGNKITTLKDIKKAKWTFLHRLPIGKPLNNLENNLVHETSDIGRIFSR